MKAIKRAFRRKLDATLVRCAGHPAFPMLIVALAFGTALTLSMPFGWIVLTAVMLAPWRWRAISVASAAGSAMGGLLVYWVAHRLAADELAVAYPDIIASATWHEASRWVSQYGLAALFAFAALPLPLGPVVIVAATAALPPEQVAVALFAGKLAKYGTYAWVSMRFAHLPMIARILARHGVRIDGDSAKK